MHLCRKYGILAPEEPKGGPANAGPRVRGAGHGATRGTADQGHTQTETGDETGKRTLLARGIQEDGNEERSLPDRSHALNACSHQGG